MPLTKYSFVIPVYNEESVLPQLHARLLDVLRKLDGPAEVIFVNDGSHDQSSDIIRDMHTHDNRFKMIDLSRNFGHQVAVTAGLDLSVGDAVIVMDADLQDPPEVALEMVDYWKKGHDVVYAVRDTRLDESRFKEGIRRFFYRIVHRIGDVDIPVDAGDFRLMDRRALDAMNTMREHNRYVRGLSSWIGFSQASVHYDRPGRAAGESKYSLIKLFELAADGVFSFSMAPLKAALYLGFAIALLSFFLGILAIVFRLMNPSIVPGWASIVVIGSFLMGVQLIVLGVIGEYVGRIHEEVKNRPIYIVQDLVGIEDLSTTKRVYVGLPRDRTGEPS